MRHLLEDSALYERENKALKKDLDEIERKNNALEKELDGISKEHIRMRHLLKDSALYERENKALKKDLYEIERKNDALEKELDGISQEHIRMRHLLEDSALYERENKALKKDLDETERKNNALEKELDGISQERNRMEAMLGEITNKLEVAIDEKENVTSHYSTKMENSTLSYEREIRDLKKEFDVTNEELNVMKTRAALVDELTVALEEALVEKEEATLSLGRLKKDLRSALAETDEVVYKYNQLEMAHINLQAIKDSESHMVELLRKQRDSMNVRLEEYLDEIENLGTAMTEISNERNDLKDELICVLETAESAFR